MADVLSQSEVESLLAALDPGAEQGTMGAAGERGETNGTQINVYDFKRPERVSKEQMRARRVWPGVWCRSEQHVAEYRRSQTHQRGSAYLQ